MGTGEDNLGIGTQAWQHANWQEGFYPHDLPDDWQLTYYANEFAFVVVPYQQWCEADEALLEQWQEDTHEGFRLYLALDLPQAAEVDWSTLTALGPRWGGVICRLQGAVNKGSEAEQALKTLAAALPAGCELHLDAAPADIAELPWNGIWNGEGRAHWPQAGGVFCRLATERYAEPRQIRELLESCAAQSVAGQRMMVLFDDASPSFELMHSARIVAELLGL